MNREIEMFHALSGRTTQKGEEEERVEEAKGRAAGRGSSGTATLLPAFPQLSLLDLSENNMEGPMTGVMVAAMLLSSDAAAVGAHHHRSGSCEVRLERCCLGDTWARSFCAHVADKLPVEGDGRLTTRVLTLRLGHNRLTHPALLCARAAAAYAQSRSAVSLAECSVEGNLIVPPPRGGSGGRILWDALDGDGSRFFPPFPTFSELLRRGEGRHPLTPRAPSHAPASARSGAGGRQNTGLTPLSHDPSAVLDRIVEETERVIQQRSGQNVLEPQNSTPRASATSLSMEEAYMVMAEPF